MPLEPKTPFKGIKHIENKTVEVNFLEGGIGSLEVKIEVKSQVGQGIESFFCFYVRPLNIPDFKHKSFETYLHEYCECDGICNPSEVRDILNSFK